MTFAFERFGVRPDAFTLAKGLANGLPIGALVIDDRCADALQPGDHGSTFGGSPVPCAAALEHLRLRDELQLNEHVQHAGTALRAGLYGLSLRFPEVFGDVRGAGLMLGLQVHEPHVATDLVRIALDHGLLINAAGHNTLRFVPPLIISKAEIERAISILAVLL
jgi:acetylornithine/succinyldiaminopimelate/putrescine aminotransferase